MKTLREYARKAKELGYRIDTWIIRHIFDRFYRTSGANCKLYGYDFPKRDNPLATSFLGWDYLLDRFGEVSIRDPTKRR